MRKFGYYVVYAIVLVLFLYFGSQIYQQLRVSAGRTYQPFPVVAFSSFFPIFIGLFLALPNLLSKAKEQGSWTINWIKLITIGTVSLFLAMSPILYFFTPIGQQAPHISWLYQFNPAVTISGVVFGYLVLSIPQKSTENKNSQGV